MSEHMQLVEMLNKVLQEVKDLKAKVENTDTIPPILDPKLFKKHFKMTEATQQKYRTNDDVNDKLPYTNQGGIRYVTKDVLEWFHRNQLNAKTQ